MSNTAILLVCLVAGFFVLANAIYAIKSPADFMKAKWTAKRGMELEDVRLMGLIYVLLAGFCFWCAYVTLRKIVSEGIC